MILSMKLLVSVALCIGVACEALGQKGDHGITNQPVRVPREKIPPAPPLSPQQSLETFLLPSGFHLELVASEPMIEMPVAMAFDPDRRIFVLEMRGFMPDVDANGEKEP